MYRKELQLLHRIRDCGSVGCAIACVLQLRIKSLPCNLNSAPVIEYVLIPFSLVRRYDSVTSDDDSDLSNTITIYVCSAWCVSSELIPPVLRIKALPLHLADLTRVFWNGDCRCLLLEVSIIVDTLPHITCLPYVLVQSACVLVGSSLLCLQFTISFSVTLCNCSFPSLFVCLWL
jgi:hypothetical protein